MFDDGMVNQLPVQPTCKTGSDLAASTAILAGDRDGTHGCNVLWIHSHSFSSVGFERLKLIPLAAERSQFALQGHTHLGSVRQQGQHLAQGHSVVMEHESGDIHVTGESWQVLAHRAQHGRPGFGVVNELADLTVE
jgi:hypothetical protein